VWYFGLLPLVLVRLPWPVPVGLRWAGAGWAAAQLHWLLWAYLLEFQVRPGPALMLRRVTVNLLGSATPVVPSVCSRGPVFIGTSLLQRPVSPARLHLCCAAEAPAAVGGQCGACAHPHRHHKHWRADPFQRTSLNCQSWQFAPQLSLAELRHLPQLGTR
jgi:hypothetical protein